MIPGITVDFNELLALSQYVQKALMHKAIRPASFFGEHTSKTCSRGMDFAESRHYQFGDDVKRMEWRSTARTGKPHVKVYHEEKEVPVIILVDFNSSMYFGTRIMFKSVVAAKLAACLAWAASKQGDRVGGLLSAATHHDEYAPRGRDLGVLPLLKGLCQYTEKLESDSSSLVKSLLRLQSVARSGSVLVVIGDFYNFDADSAKIFQHLKLKYNLLVYQIFDALELTLPQAGCYTVTDGNNTNIWDTTSMVTQVAYQKLIIKRSTELKDFCLKNRINYNKVTASDDLAQLVCRTFVRRAHD